MAESSDAVLLWRHMATEDILKLLTAERDKLNAAIKALGGGGDGGWVSSGEPRAKRKVSAAARRRMAAAQKKRWAALKALAK